MNEVVTMVDDEYRKNRKQAFIYQITKFPSLLIANGSWNLPSMESGNILVPLFVNLML